MMEAARTSETLVNFYQTTRRYNSEDSYLLSYCQTKIFYVFIISLACATCPALSPELCKSLEDVAYNDKVSK
jgi:hypothetical protein